VSKMPFPIAAAIAAGSSVLGTGLSALSTNRANRANRDFQSEMYNRQYKDSIDFWHMQNAYNSPESQMQRMKDAGINPLVPFTSGSGMASSQAGQIQTPQRGNYDQKTPDFSGIAGAGTKAIDAMYSLEMRSAQIDNLKAQNSNIYADTALKAANAIRTETSTQGETLRNQQFGP